MVMRCETCRELLSPFLDEVCSEKENKMVEAHLAVCPGCRDQLEELRRMVGALHQLTLPSLPEGFAESLHRRLDAENLIFFPPQEFKVPRRQSWIAAAIAGLALAGGIYASTVLPLGSMIASWGDQGQNTDNKPHITISDVIDKVTRHNKVNVADKNTAGTGTPVGKTPTAGTPDKKNPTDPAKGSTGEGTARVSTNTGQTEKLFANSSSVVLAVKNASESRQQVVQIAAANGMSYSYNNNAGMQAMVGPQGVTIKAEAQDVDKVMQQLAALGQVSKPTQDTVDLSDKLADIENKLAQAQAEKVSLTEAGTSNEEQTHASELNTKIQALTAEKAQLEKEEKLVTINVYFMEDVCP